MLIIVINHRSQDDGRRVFVVRSFFLGRVPPHSLVFLTRARWPPCTHAGVFVRDRDP